MRRIMGFMKTFSRPTKPKDYQMPKWTVFCCLIISFYFSAFCQTDTIYYDANWEETVKDSAEYYRISEKKERLYHVRDYYLSGALQMEGNYTSFDPDIREGYFKWYYESGQKFAEGNFVHGQREGLWTFWFPDGLKKEVIEFSPKKPDYFSVKWRSKRVKNSINFLEKAIRKRRRGKYEKALFLLNNAIALNPYFANAYFERGLIRCRIYEKEAACADLKKAKQYIYLDTEALNEQIERCCK